MKKIIIVVFTILLVVLMFSACDLSNFNMNTDNEKNQTTKNKETTKNIVILYEGGKPIHFWITKGTVFTFTSSDLTAVNNEIDVHGTTITIKDVKVSDVRNVCKEYGITLDDSYDDTSDYHSIY